MNKNKSLFTIGICVDIVVNIRTNKTCAPSSKCLIFDRSGPARLSWIFSSLERDPSKNNEIKKNNYMKKIHTSKLIKERKPTQKGKIM